MAEYNPPAPGWDLGAFNPYYFSYGLQSLTLDEADARYLRKTGGYVSGSLTIGGTLDTTALSINGVPIDLTSISGITPGTVSASKAVIVDSSKNITGFNSLSATTLTGTLQTAAQPNITSLGTLTGISLNGNINLGSNPSTSFNNNIIITGSASSPTNTVGIGMGYNGAIATGRIKAYNYILSQYNNIDINDGAIYVKADKSIGIGTITPFALLDLNQASSTSKRLRLSYTVNSVFGELYCDSNGSIVIPSNVRPLSMLKSDLTNGNGISWALGRSGATDQQGECTFTYSSTAGQSTLSLGHFGTPQMLQVYSTGLVNISGTTDSSSSITGILTVGGGAGIAKKLYVGGGIYGTIMTASQPNITSIGGTGTSLYGTLMTGPQPNISSTGTLDQVQTVGYVQIDNHRLTSSTSNFGDYAMFIKTVGTTPAIGDRGGISFISNNQTVSSTAGAAISSIRAGGTYQTSLAFSVRNDNTNTGPCVDRLVISPDGTLVQNSVGGYNMQMSSAVGGNVFINMTQQAVGMGMTLINGVLQSGIMGSISLSGDGISIDNNGGNLYLGVNALAHWRIDTNGYFAPFYQPQNRRIGVQTSSPACPLHVGGATVSDRILGLYWSGVATDDFYGLGTNDGSLKCQGNKVSLHSQSKGNSTGTQCMVAHYANSKGVVSIGTEGGSTASDLNILRTTAGIRVGKAESVKNAFTIQWNHSSDGSSNNSLSFDSYGSSNQLVLGTGGYVLMNEVPTNGRGALHINQYATFTYSSSKQYNIATNSYSTISSSSIDLSIYAVKNIWCESIIACSSDRRMKSSIMPYSISDEDFMSLRPKRYIKDEKWQIGLVAQDVVASIPNLYPDIVSACPNKDMKKTCEEDPDDGFSWVLNYDRLPILNMAVVQRLLRRIETLEEQHQQDEADRHELNQRLEYLESMLS